MMEKQGLFFLYRILKAMTVVEVIVSLSFLPVAAAQINENALVIKESKKQEASSSQQNDDKADKVGDRQQNTSEVTETPEATTAPEPPELPTIEGEPALPQPSRAGGHNTLLWVGAGVAGVAVLALALGGGGGGDGGGGGGETTSTPTPPPADKPFSGPIISGQWSGSIDLVEFDPETVTASITQDGENVTITTSTSRPYGRKFVGTIDEKGVMLVYDQETGEDWTTSEGNATETTIILTDWVSESGDLDRLELHR